MGKGRIGDGSHSTPGHEWDLLRRTRLRGCLPGLTSLLPVIGGEVTCHLHDRPIATGQPSRNGPLLVLGERLQNVCSQASPGTSMGCNSLKGAHRRPLGEKHGCPERCEQRGEQGLFLLCHELDAGRPHVATLPLSLELDLAADHLASEDQSHLVVVELNVHVERDVVATHLAFADLP